MKVWVMLLVTVVLCSISMVEPRSSSIAALKDEQKHKFDEIKFSTKTANRRNYMNFINELRQALLAHGGDISGNIALLPPQTMSATNPRRYLMVELSTGDQIVTLALDVTNAYVLGYRRHYRVPETETEPESTELTSYFFNDVPQAVRDVLFPDIPRSSLSHSGTYQSLEGAAGLGDRRDRRDVPLGIGQLEQHIRDMNRYEPAPSGINRNRIARALLVCIQMVSEAARFRNIEQLIAEVAEPIPIPGGGGTYGELYPDDLMMGFQTNWGQLSEAVATATTSGIFRTVSVDTLQFQTIESVRFLLALVLVVCQGRVANPHFLHMPTSIISSSLPMRSTGLERNDEQCERVLEPTTHITGRDGLCVGVSRGSYHNGNWIAVSTCVQNQGFQLWTLRSDNTIRSGGKCLTTYGYTEGNYVMIFDCNTAIADATKWEIQSDGSIKNPRSGLFLVATKDAKGALSLVVGRNSFSSNQVFYATNSTTPLGTKLVGYGGRCLRASAESANVRFCDNNIFEMWAKYPDGTIRPQRDPLSCLKYGNPLRSMVYIEACNGMSEERWQFVNDGTIFHPSTGNVLSVVPYSGVGFLAVTVSPVISESLYQIWFQVPRK